MCTAKRVSKVLSRMGYRIKYDSIRDYISLFGAITKLSFSVYTVGIR